MPGAAKKPYRSALRQAQARSTRLLILDAARRLFVERGYVATSVDAIAEAAGVGRATVFASVGGKAALLKQAYDVGLVGDDESAPLVERPRSRSIRAEPDSRRYLARYAELVTEISGRIAGIYEAVRQASGADAEARTLWADILRQRRLGMDNLVRDLSSKGPLRASLDTRQAADLAWVLTDPWHYHMLVMQSGWTPARFQEWLTQTLQEQLLPPQRDGHRPAQGRSRT